MRNMASPLVTRPIFAGNAPRLQSFAKSPPLAASSTGQTTMLKVAVFLALAAVCLAQTPTRPNIAETFSSAGNFEVHDTRGTFFGQFIVDRDQSKNMGVENGTFKTDDAVGHYETLELYSTGDRYTVRQEGSGEPHCEMEKVTGNLPQYWSWVSLASYTGNFTFHEVVYDSWTASFGGVELSVLVPMTDPNTPKFFRRKMGPFIIGFEFTTFSTTEPPAKDFTVPTACSQ